MDILAVVAAVLLALGFGIAGVSKLARLAPTRDAASHLGLAENQFMLIGASEVAGVVAVVLGALVDSLAWLGIVGAVGLILLGAGALYFHRKAGDEPKEFAPAAVLMVIAIVYIVAVASA